MAVLLDLVQQMIGHLTVLNVKALAQHAFKKPSVPAVSMATGWIVKFAVKLYIGRSPG